MLWHATHAAADVLRVSLGLYLPAEEVLQLYADGALRDARELATQPVPGPTPV